MASVASIWQRARRGRHSAVSRILSPGSRAARAQQQFLNTGACVPRGWRAEECTTAFRVMVKRLCRVLVTQGSFSRCFSEVSLCVLSGAPPGCPVLGGQKHEPRGQEPTGGGCCSWMGFTPSPSPGRSQWAEGGAAEMEKRTPSFLASPSSSSSETCGRALCVVHRHHET